MDGNVHLKEQNRPVSVDEFVETVADWDDSAVDQEHIAIELQHTHLPKATEVNFIEYKPDAGLVEVQGPPPKFTAIPRLPV
ncbi:DUF7344 domain-containing protein [Haloterrigena alkaliphila]|uniref:DUF7344 domain-containing protein n=1 Tax=Haloterrigena alkaliphila TaxID=2816475 RepID=UPI003CE5682A